MKTEIYLCKVQFSVTDPKLKDEKGKPLINLMQPEKIVLNLDEKGNPIFKQYEMQNKHNNSLTPTQKSKIVDLKVIEKITFLGNPVLDITTDKRLNFKYNGKYTGSKK